MGELFIADKAVTSILGTADYTHIVPHADVEEVNGMLQALDTLISGSPTGEAALKAKAEQPSSSECTACPGAGRWMTVISNYNSVSSTGHSNLVSSSTAPGEGFVTSMS